mmetsp:Transcript_9851/g.25253  ORF Transcript_9851/g.25253 Transcript_9851/m.25253 type:complete len:225 (-) Transcript_9851:107-781(-)
MVAGPIRTTKPRKCQLAGLRCAATAPRGSHRGSSPSLAPTEGSGTFANRAPAPFAPGLGRGWRCSTVALAAATADSVACRDVPRQGATVPQPPPSPSLLLRFLSGPTLGMPRVRLEQDDIFTASAQTPSLSRGPTHGPSVLVRGRPWQCGDAWLVLGPLYGHCAGLSPGPDVLRARETRPSAARQRGSHVPPTPSLPLHRVRACSSSSAGPSPICPIDSSHHAT